MAVTRPVPGGRVGGQSVRSTLPGGWHETIPAQRHGHRSRHCSQSPASRCPLADLRPSSAFYVQLATSWRFNAAFMSRAEQIIGRRAF